MLVANTVTPLADPMYVGSSFIYMVFFLPITLGPNIVCEEQIRVKYFG